MSQPKTKEMVSSWGFQAIERLTQSKLPPTPENYAVLYHYFSKDTPALVEAVEQVLASGDLTQENIRDIYDDHLGVLAKNAELSRASEVLDHELKVVLEMIATASTGASGYTETLHDFSSKIGQSISVESLRETVVRVIKETKDIADKNHMLEKQLTEATGQLNGLRADFERVRQESQVDGLTQVGNRRYFDTQIGTIIAESKSANDPLSVLMVDIDFFKKFNDTYGHAVGDQVLKLVAKTLVENLKGRDIIARYGGEEFVILLAHTSAKDAEKIGNQLRASLAAKKLTKRSTNESLGVITISIGAAEYVGDETPEDFVNRADTALYKAKQAGRNRVMIAD